MPTIRENGGDAAPDSGTQYTISPGDVFQGSLDSTDDKDWVRVELAAGPFYYVTLNDADAFETHILDPEGNEVTFLDYDPAEIKATFSTAVSGAHYICISSNNDGSVTDYEFSVGEIPPPPEGSYDEIADFMTDGFSGRQAFDVGTGGTLTADVTALTIDGQQLVRKALEAWTGVSGIGFELVDDDNAHIVFYDDEGEPGAYAITHSTNGVIISSEVHIPVTGRGGSDISLVASGLRIIIHEIGHALGLGHPGPYNESFTIYGVDNIFMKDTWQTTVMSYFAQDRDSRIEASLAYPITPMIADIIAIQNLYGVPTDIRAGDTVYGYRSNIDGYLGEVFANWTGETDTPFRAPIALTLYDNGGTDTLDLRTDVADQRVDLRPEGISDVYGLVGNLVIARDTLIENFIAGSGNDEIIANAAANRLSGGAGTDTVSYTGSDAGVTVTLRDGAGRGGYAEGDVLTGIEHLIGSGHADIFGGDSHGNRLYGMDGDDGLWGSNGGDVLEGGAGADRLHGGPGADTASYASSDAAVVVRLHSMEARGGHAEGDTFIGMVTVDGTEVPDIEHLLGSSYADTLAGDLRDNTLMGRAGDDTLYGGPGGGDDEMYGENGNDRMFGGKGNDTLVGGAGDDTLSGGPDDDTFVFAPGGGNDTITDFTGGEDNIDLSAFGGIDSFDDLSMEQQGGGVVIDLSGQGGGTILLSDFALASLDASDFIL